jgi:AAA domain-containing protein
LSNTNALSMLLHGPSKAGKSTLSFTGPFPLLVLDAEGSTKFITEQGFKSGKKVRKISWNPLAGPPPRHDDTWDACVVQVPNWQTIDLAYQHLCVSPHDFKSVTLDSVTEMQNKCKNNMNVSAMQQQDWGRLLDAMDKLIRGIRDLTLLPDNPLQVAVFIAETKMINGKWRPYMQGAVGDRLPYWVDICGYVMQVDTPDSNGQMTGKQVQMVCTNNAQYEAGERVQGKLPAIIADPNITHILNHIYA